MRTPPWTAAALLLAAAAHAQAPIASIPMDSLPAETNVVSSSIVLDGATQVNGDLLLKGGLAFTSDVAAKLQLSAAEFVLVESANLAAYGYLDGSIYTQSSFFAAQAPVRLPKGATMVDLSCGVVDDNVGFDLSSNAKATLYRRTAATEVTGTNVGEAALQTSGKSATLQLKSSGPLSIAVDEGDAYWLVVTFEKQPTGPPPDPVYTVAFYGCTIDYTVAAWAP